MMVDQFLSHCFEPTEPSLFLTSPIPPSVNHYLGYRAILKGGKPLAVSYCTNEAKKYKANFAEYVKEEVVKQGWNLTPNKDQHFYVDTVFYFPAINLDGNNYFKCMLDAITDTQLIWLDDNVVCERVQGLFYDTANPRVELHIHPVEYVGIFADQNNLNQFTARCIGCTRYVRNCRILKDATKGRIQNEIINNVCTKYKPKGD